VFTDNEVSPLHSAPS